MNFQPFPVIPSTGGAFVSTYQNFGANMMTNPGSAIDDKGNASTVVDKEEATQQGQSSVTSDFNTEVMTNFYQNLLNSTNIYPHAIYSGTPGMLGIGSQSQIMPQAVPAPSFVGQYINPSFENFTEIEPPHASYGGLPGMEGEGSQVQGSISSLDIAKLPQIPVLKQTDYVQIMNYTSSRNSGSVYNGIPGMLGTGSMVRVSNTGTERMHTYGGSERNTTDGRSHTQGFKFQSIPLANSGLSSYGMGAVQQTKVNNWNGDWPGEMFYLTCLFHFC